MIFSCPECQYSQENEPFELCPNCVKKELAELKADLVAAHAHIDALHPALFEMLGMLKLATVQSSSLVKAIDLDNNIANVKALVASWEDDQCPF